MENEELRIRLGANGRESVKRFSKERICEGFYEFLIPEGQAKKDNRKE